MHNSRCTQIGDPTDDEYEAGWAITRTILSDDTVVPTEWSLKPRIDTEILREELFQDTFVGDLAENIKTYSSSIFFGVLQRSQIPVVAKYTNNCAAIFLNDGRYEDELLLEFKMYNAVKELNIVPQVFYLSPLVKVHAFDNDKVLTKSMLMNAERVRTCRGRATARLMIQAEVGCDMFAFTKNIVNALRDQNNPHFMVLKSIVQVGVHLIELLQKLHNAGIIHGDIHEGNAAFENDIDTATSIDWTSNKVVLLDLGMARFYPDEISLPKNKRRQRNKNLAILSPWNILNSRVGRRDDLYRAMELVCNLMMGHSLRDYLQRTPSVGSLSSVFATYYGLRNEEYLLATNKMRANLFQPDVRINKPSALSKFGLNKNDEETISFLLDEVVTRIRLIPSADTRPKYDEYITLMNEVIEIIDRVDIPGMEKFSLPIE